MRIIALALLATSATSAMAETAPIPTATSTAMPATVSVRTGQMLRDAANLRIGAVDTVRPDGSVGVIVEGHYRVIPARTLAMTDGKLTTSLTKAALAAK